MANEQWPLVVIDAGHDDEEPGSTQADGEREDRYTLRLAQAARTALLTNYQCRVVLTREGPAGMVPGTDLREELRARGQLPNQLGAAFFLSLHHNAASDPAAEGAEYYIYTERRAPDGGLVWIPAVDPKTGQPNHNAPRSYEAAQLMVPILEETVGRFGIKWRYWSGAIRCAGFGVLNYPQLPCGLFESHFGSSPREDDIADTEEFIQGVAAGIARALGAALHLQPVETWTLPKVLVRLPSDRELWGMNWDGETWVRLTPEGGPVPIRQTAEALGRQVQYIENPPTAIVL